MSAIGSRLRARWYLVLLACIVAVAAALTVKYKVGSGGIESKRRPLGVGAAQLLVDSQPSTLATVANGTAAQTLEERAPLYAEFGTGTAIKTKVAAQAGVPFNSLTMIASTDQVIPGATQNTAQTAATPEFVVLTATKTSPVVKIYAQARTAAIAGKLAAATSRVLRGHIARLAAAQKIDPNTAGGPVVKVVLRPLGQPYGTTVYTTGKTKKAVAIGVVAIIVLLIVILVLDNLLLTWRDRRAERRAATA